MNGTESLLQHAKVCSSPFQNRADQCRLQECSSTASCNFASGIGPAVSPAVATSPASIQTPTIAVLPTLPQSRGPIPASPSQTNYLCGEQGQVNVPGSLYTAIQSSVCCVRTAGAGTCTIGDSIVDLNLYANIKAGACNQVVSQH